VLDDVLHRIIVFSAIVVMISSIWVAAWAKQEASQAQQGWWPALPPADHNTIVTSAATIPAQASR